MSRTTKFIAALSATAVLVPVASSDAVASKGTRAISSSTKSKALHSKNPAKRTAALRRVQRAVVSVMAEEKARDIKNAAEWAAFCKQAGGEKSGLSVCNGGRTPGSPGGSLAPTGKGSSGASAVCDGYVKQRNAWTSNPSVQGLRDKAQQAVRDAREIAGRMVDLRHAAQALRDLAESMDDAPRAKLALLTAANDLDAEVTKLDARWRMMMADSVILEVAASNLAAQTDSKAPEVGEDGTRTGGGDDLARRRCEEYLAKNYLFDRNGPRPKDTNTCDDQVVNPAPGSAANGQGGGQAAPPINCSPKTETVGAAGNVANPKPTGCTTGDGRICDDGVKPNVPQQNAGPAPVPANVQACDPKVCSPTP